MLTEIAKNGGGELGALQLLFYSNSLGLLPLDMLARANGVCSPTACEGTCPGLVSSPQAGF